MKMRVLTIFFLLGGTLPLVNAQSYLFVEWGGCISLVDYSPENVINVTNTSSPAFAYTLSYDKVNVTGAIARYDGNVNAMTWKNGSGSEKAYIYTYDPMGQLKSASYKEKSGTIWVENPTGKYNTHGLTYDLNGNIKTLQRNSAGGAPLHALKYTYGVANNGNAVSQITFGNTTSGTYVYDANGNMTTDGRRGVTIAYNELKLPSVISKGDAKISYIYSATGEKLAQQSGSSQTFYRGVMVYNGNSLDYISHPVGVTRKVSSGYVYDYFLTDHLGSTRVVLEAGGSTLVPVQTTEYYPFGLAFSHNNLDKNKHLFSGKEIQDVAFNGEMLGLYDFGSRFYDPLVGRWFCQDPASQLMSPYGYCGNNPVAFVDPNGEFAWLAFGIGAAFGSWMGGTIANNGEINPTKWDWNSGQTWGYMFGGSAIGGLSGALGGAIAAEGGFLANTGAIMAGSYVNSLGMSVMTNGEIAPGISFGAVSLDFKAGFNYLGKKGNSWLQDLGYVFGAMANLSDLLAWNSGVDVDAITEKKDAISHAALVKQAKDINISVGPEGGNYFDKGASLFKKVGNLFEQVEGDLWQNHANDGFGIKLKINNVNQRILKSFSNNIKGGRNLLGGPLKYSGIGNSCVSYTSRALWMVGIPNIGVHPYLWQSSLLVRQVGMYSNPYLILK